MIHGTHLQQYRIDAFLLLVKVFVGTSVQACDQTGLKRVQPA